MEYNVDSREVSLIARPYSGIKHSYWFLIVGLGFFFIIIFEKYVGKPIVVLGELAMLAMFVAWACSYRTHRRAAAKFADRKADPHLICYGNPDDLRAVADLEDVSTEPYIVQLYGNFPKQYVTPNEPWYAKPGRVFPVVFVSIFLTVLIFFKPLRYLMLNVFILAWASYFCANWFIFPIYLRVTPGQMEILCFGPFRKRARKCKPIVLKNAHIELDFAKRKLSVWQRGAKKPERVIPLGGVRDAQGLARAVFACALAPQSMPALPDDELLG